MTQAWEEGTDFALCVPVLESRPMSADARGIEAKRAWLAQLNAERSPAREAAIVELARFADARFS